jgi:hypothetical protein
MTAVVGAVLVLLRDGLAGLVHPDLLVRLLGDSALLTGLLRILGGFAAERRLGRRWTLGGMVLGTLEAVLGGVALLSADVDPEVLWRWPPPGRRLAGACWWQRGCGCAAWHAPGGHNRSCQLENLQGFVVR